MMEAAIKTGHLLTSIYGNAEAAERNSGVQLFPKRSLPGEMEAMEATTTTI
jgi:hypothetical protein